MPTGRHHTESDELLRVLSDPRRRQLLWDLRASADGTLSVAELTQDNDIDDQQGERIDEVDLRHVHLPVLADCGLVEYDADGATVHYREREDARKLLDFLAEELS